MENLRHCTTNTARNFSAAAASSSAPSVAGQNMFYETAVDLVSSACYPEFFPHVSNEKSDFTCSPGGTKELQQVYSVCSAYTEELTYLWQAGLRLARCLQSSLSFAAESLNSSCASPNPFEMAGHFVGAWDQLSLTTRNLVSGFEDGALAALRESLLNEDKEKDAAETKKMLLTCFLAVIQVHYQFSYSMLDSVIQLFTPTTFLQSQNPTSAKDSSETFSMTPDLLTSWNESILEIQKNLATCIGNLNQQTICNKPESSNAFPFEFPENPPSRRRWSFGGLRHASPTIDWSMKPWTTVTGQLQQRDVHKMQSLWSHDATFPPSQMSDDARFLSFEAFGNKKRGSADSQKSGTFASNEELQDVISLLSCQPSNPSSPTVETPLPMNNGQNFFWPSTMEINTPATPTEISDEYPSWDGSNSTFVDSRLRPIYDLTKITETQRGHQPATKSTSWPATKCSVPPPRSNGYSNVDDATFTGTRSKVQGFFMGLDLVGTDLMATVRQRRHSSGESLCKNNQMATSSVRTKSTDNITSEGKSCRISTWPLKQVGPHSAVNYIHDSRVEDTVKWATVAACTDHSTGLPPSGMECRNKTKGERKYSLFGNPT